MAAPVSYTESSLAAYMVATLDSVATALGLTAMSTSIVTAVTAVERLLGVSDVVTATDMALVEAAARWQAWLAADAAASVKFDLKAGSAQLWQSQIFAQIQSRLDSEYGFYLIEKARVAAATGTGVFAFGLAHGRRG